jgi:AraC-like DNA-binding protein
MMVRNGHSFKIVEGGEMAGSPVTDVSFREPAGTLPGVAVLSLTGLIERARDHGVDPFAPMRPEFHHLVTISSGHACAVVDFTEHPLAVGDWLWVRPRQILQFGRDLAAAQGIVVLFQPGFLDDATVAAAQVDRPAGDSSTVRSTSATAVARLLAAEYRSLGDLPLEANIDVVRHLLSVILVRLAQAEGAESAIPSGATFRRFRAAVERDFTHAHRVEDYALTLGYSVRTLTRACQEATGRRAKQVIDDRVVLEAKRLLVHTELTGAAIGARVGMPDPTAFTKFFRTRVGETPAAFRTRVRGT